MTLEMKAKEPNVHAIGIQPGKVTLAVTDWQKFMDNNEQEAFKIGSYIKLGNKAKSIIAVVQNYHIKSDIDIDNEKPVIESSSYKKRFVIDCLPIGSIKGDQFVRGGHDIAIPPADVKLLTEENIKDIYKLNVSGFSFGKLAMNNNIPISVDGNKFFNKHLAVVGSTGSGKSNTVAKIIQNAVSAKSGEYEGLNNSHVIIFDIHSEYKKAFTDPNYIDVENLKLPFWMLNGDELEDLFIESNEQNSHNQISQFRYAVTKNKKIHAKRLNSEITEEDLERIHFDSPKYFNIEEVLNYLTNLNNEIIDKVDGSLTYGMPKLKDGTKIDSEESRAKEFFSKKHTFAQNSTKAEIKASNGAFLGEFDRFIVRLENILNNKRLNFLLKGNENLAIKDILQSILGYQKKANVTIIDLSGVPFEVLSIVVALISRILFEYGFVYLKKYKTECETPLLLVYEEAHKYAPRSDLAKYKTSKQAIERIAKEGRKYGTSLMVVSQRPSDVSEVIFSQCSNFVCMRLTNPDDQSYVKKLLPDNLGNLIDNLPTLQQGEAFIIGDAISIPSLVQIDECDPKPSSHDIPYFDKWKEKWHEVEFEEIVKLF